MINNKYRGFSKAANRWFFGFLTSNHKKECFIGYHSQYDNKYCFYRVEPETVGQYSGEKDIHGIEIYTGDSPSKGNYVEFSFGCFNINGDSPLSDWKNFEVIGNRYGL